MKAVIIGAGFAGISAATRLAQAGWQVEVVEKNEMAGGRARVWEQDGFTFDMGPSWYWMPDVFEWYFEQFKHSVGEFYNLTRLDPSYRVIFTEQETWDIPADLGEFKALLETHELGSGAQLDAFLAQAKYKYQVGIHDLVHKPSLSALEFVDTRLLGALFKMDVFQSFEKHIRRFFKHPKILQLMEFPILFLGALPKNTPALYSLMNYADIQLGTWYPMGGMHNIVKGMVQVAENHGVRFHYNQPAQRIKVQGNKAMGVLTPDLNLNADVVIGGADYHHVESRLLPASLQTYTEKYWKTRTFAPSCLIFYIGLNKRLENLRHHNLFFDTDFGLHATEIYETPRYPTNPLFYASCPSVTDSSVAPEGCENLFLLIPIATDLVDSEVMREHYYNLVMNRLEKYTGQEIRKHVVVKRSFAQDDFVSAYNACRGNAYGLANTLMQTAILKPRIQSKKVKNLYFTGQLTVPGPGVPPSLISGQVVANEILKKFV
ncbi:MAG: phytoene desaturase [Bacteroidetes bacterium]|nr:MAG: phytoene desaturase [Bacteroidota bacterium]